MNKQQQKLLGYSYDLLARRRYTIKQMITKLDTANQKSLDPLAENFLQEILEHLVKSNFLNDKQYAEFYIDSQIRKKPIGKLKLKQQLNIKGIPKDIIEQALNTADLNETQLAQAAILRKLGLSKLTAANSPNQQFNLPKLNLNQKQKLFRYLQSNGFNSGAIFKALNFSREE